MNDNKGINKDKNILQHYAEKIINVMKEHEYVSAGEIISELGLSYQEGMKYISELQNMGIINKTQISSYYTLNDKYREY